METKIGNKKNIATLVVIIALLVISLPAAIYGLANRDKDVKNEEESPTDNFKFNGKLHFYIGSTLFFEYNCISDDCDYATGTIDDEEYSLQYYKDAKDLKIGRTMQIRNVFLKDNGEQFFVNFKNPNDKNVYQAIKDYGIGIHGDMFIVKKNDKWGLVKISGTADTGLEVIIEPKYDYIGLRNRVVDLEGVTALDNSYFAVYNSGEGWNLVDSTGKIVLMENIPSIVNYNSKIIAVKGEFNYSVYDFSNNIIYQGLLYADIIGNYLLIVNNENNLYVYEGNEPNKQMGGTEIIPVEFNLNDLPISYSLNSNNRLTITIRSVSGDPKTIVY